MISPIHKRIFHHTEITGSQCVNGLAHRAMRIMCNMTSLEMTRSQNGDCWWSNTHMVPAYIILTRGSVMWTCHSIIFRNTQYLARVWVLRCPLIDIRATIVKTIPSLESLILVRRLLITRLSYILMWVPIHIPDSKVHGANMGPTWVLSAQDGPHVGPMNLAIRDGKRDFLYWNGSPLGLLSPHRSHSYLRRIVDDGPTLVISGQYRPQHSFTSSDHSHLWLIQSVGRQRAHILLSRDHNIDY